MATPHEFPGNFSTNTYILQDFSEVAYIVCSAAIPAASDRYSNVQDINSKPRMLERLRNAEKQFRQASIMVYLDPEKLELFTFYKKVDILKDQKGVLTKFGQVCKLNHCIIAYKNACRVLDFLKPEMARIYELFSAAVISNLRLQGPDGSKAISAGSRTYLVRAQRPVSDDFSPIQWPQALWYLQKIELQVVPSGQLLLAVHNANWSPLTAVSDAIDPDASPIDHSDGTTLYLAPTGQLARYKGIWITSMTLEQGVLANQRGQVKDLQWRKRWMEKVQVWLGKRNSDLVVPFGPGTIWLQTDIPVLVQPESNDSKTTPVQWKTVYWPVVLSYAFTVDQRSDGKSSPVVGSDDPLKVAQEWFLNGAADARHTDTDMQDQTDDHLIHGNGPLFDDEVHFGSPQQFMSLPMQTFAQAQTVYPTPPDVMNTQATPGLSVNGAGQTPATAQQTPAAYHSSPLATMTDVGGATYQQPAIANFLAHDANDDLFDDMEDDEIDQQSLANEPNWDFFNVGNLEEESKYQLEGQTSEHSFSPNQENAEHAVVAPEQDESPDGFAAEQPRPDIDHPSHELVHTKHDIGSEQQPQSHVKDTVTTRQSITVSDTNAVTTNIPVGATTPSGKRRRSSAYDVAPVRKSTRDSKYAANGKYWFELRKPAIAIDKYPAPTPSTRRISSGSDSSRSSQSLSDYDHEDTDRAPLPSWTQYTPVAPAAAVPQPDDVDGSDLAECDDEIDALLKVIALATGQEPFTTSMPAPRQSHVQTQDDAERRSMVVQLLSEQLTQSSLLRGIECLRLPRLNQIAVADISVDNAGSSTSLSSASVSDLVAIQPANPHAKTASKITTLEHSKLRLRQTDSDIAADLSIINFWETLNLQPVSGDKDVLALCIHPDGINYLAGCESFLQRMSETYSSCNLGLHRRTSLKGVTATGLVSWRTLSDLPNICRRVGRALASTDSEEECTIIYMIIPDDDLTLCLELCGAFVEVYETLNHDANPEIGDVVLQLVPSSFVVDSDTLVIRPEEQYVDLALEVYHKIPPLLDVPNSALCAPAILLEEPTAHSIQFEMNTKSASPLSKYGQCCHLAYCLSSDQKWLVATWSDAIGNIALSMSYCLFDEETGTKRAQADIFEHMCEISTQLMSRQKSTWWLAVAKVGLFDTEELREWLHLSGQLNEGHDMLSRVVLLTVELQPRLCLQGLNPSSKHFQTLNPYGPNTLSTPVSTPQASNTLSPEQLVPATPTTIFGFAGNAQTPPEHNTDAGGENETFLVDPLEDSWTATFAFGLNQSHNFLEIRPALASGFLLKRTAPQGHAGTSMASLSVNLIAVPRKPASPVSFQEREQILQDILIQYRGLHTLGVARRCIDPRDNCVPWHIAIAWKGASALERFA
ncbi:mediator of RNA polymerase II transcription subunit 13 [Knufia obscura]|uniref:Mediator of RNA polymerase II transcription subunit 13 n=2 Tax=Knufia TaxID=430999 RepID=A0AAN8I3P2_9EURO|nr:mediator of RNA polymerase II transcription subunit 13 [Knufia obscura]KAK5948755.1 mediator of RNA polymerase II transcription subunit 13 [Knufia fluminis]